MKRQRTNVSSLPPSPDADRRSRMIKYSVTMGIRFICIIAIFFVQGWWILFFAIGAVFLPYFAVIIANVAKKPVQQEVDQPSAIVISSHKDDE